MTKLKPKFIPPEDNTPAYNMIRQFGRKNWNVVKKYIEIFSKEGNIIYDPFGGCGVLAYEGLKIDRKVIYNDLNPFQYFAAIQLCTPVDLNLLEKAYKDLIKNLESKEYIFTTRATPKPLKLKLKWFVSTKCNCGKEGIIKVVYYDDQLIYKKKSQKERILSKELKESYRNKVLEVIKKHKNINKEDLTSILKSKIDHFNKHPYTIENRLKFLEKENLIKRESFIPLKIKYLCSCSKKDKIKEILDGDDLNKNKKIKEIKPPFYVPDGKLFYKNGKRFITKRKIDHVADLFTKRNLIILSIIRKEILDLKYNRNVIDTLLLCFASILFDTSIMNREGAGSWGAKEYWIPTHIIEVNPIESFKSRFKISYVFGKELGILAGKKEIFRDLNGKIKVGKRVQDLNNNYNMLFYKKDARDLYFDKNIDYIFTDPSYGDAIQYGELTYMIMNWLEMKMPFDNEIILNKNQGKTIDVYRDMLMAAFEKIYISLKHGGYLTVTFHSRKASIWNSLMYAINCNNFEYIDAIYQPKPKEHSNFIYRQKPGAMNGDIYITFRKNELLAKDLSKITIEQLIQEHIVPEAKKVIHSRRGKSVTYDQLVRAITLRLIRKHLLHRKEIAELNYKAIFDKYLLREETKSSISKRKTKKDQNNKKLTSLNVYLLKGDNNGDKE